MSEKRRAYVDVETSGLNPHRHCILAISIRFDEGEAPDSPLLVKDGDSLVWTTKVQGERIEDAEAEALAVNGYTNDLWEGAPTFSEVAPHVLSLLEDAVIVGHGVSFDYGFIVSHLISCGLDTSRISRRLVDTATLVYEHMGHCGLASRSLDSVRRFFGWSAPKPHTADRDTADTRRLYHKLCRATEADRASWVSSRES